MATLLLLLAVSGGGGNEVHDHFDMLEVNHVYNQYGSPVFVQLIFWDWHGSDCRFHVQGWMMMNDAFDTGDRAHQLAYEAEVDRLLSHFTDVARRSWLRRQMRYKGKFVGGRLYPVKHHVTGKYRVRFHDKRGLMRVITADIFRETHTSHDPEVDDRRSYPEEARRGLTKPRQLSSTLARHAP